jgi:hypothetical protein
MSTTLPASLGRLGFVHIPKNGGTSVAHAISEHGLPIRVSDHFYPERLAIEEIVVIRSPLDRFVSAFDYCREHWRNPVNDAFSGPNELAEAAADPEHPKHGLAEVELGNDAGHFLLRNGKPTLRHSIAGRPTRYCFIYEPQSSWLLNQPAHVLRYPCLDQDFSQLLAALELPPVGPLPRLNQSRSDKHALSVHAVEFLRKMYAADFDFIRSRGLDV